MTDTIFDAIDLAAKKAKKLLKKHKKVRMAMEPQPDGSIAFIVEPAAADDEPVTVGDDE